MTSNTKTESLPQELRDLGWGRDEWRVQDPESGTYCMAFSCGDHLDGYSLNPERDAREWLEDHKKRFPGSPKSSYVVAKVRRRTQAQELMQEAADEIERLLALVQQMGKILIVNPENGAVQHFITAADAGPNDVVALAVDAERRRWLALSDRIKEDLRRPEGRWGMHGNEAVDCDYFTALEWVVERMSEIAGQPTPPQ